MLYRSFLSYTGLIAAVALAMVLAAFVEGYLSPMLMKAMVPAMCATAYPHGTGAPRPDRVGGVNAAAAGAIYHRKRGTATRIFGGLQKSFHR